MTYAMVAALENANLYFDEETGNHVRRISLLSEFIGKRAGIDEGFVKMVKLYAPLHDIGKVGVQKEILQKPGKLTSEEFEHIKEHVSIGYRIINDRAIDTMAKNIVLYHHEKWMGSGYVHGLAGTDIPLEARIVSIADVFDALVNKRVYKEAIPLDTALDIMRKERGVSFDPDLLDAFIMGIKAIQFPEALYGQVSGS
jgi:HD-GYP domain-containing protein (c-di-GMP phosphodiesterase class II)